MEVNLLASGWIIKLTDMVFTLGWMEGYLIIHKKYEGEWSNNQMHNRGIYTWKDGRRYEGEYKFDKKDGFGKYIWVDGRKYEGFWKNGKQHGKGLYFLLDGVKKYGLWEEGKRIKWLEEETAGNIKP